MASMLSEMVKERPFRRAACGATPEVLRRIDTGERRLRIESGCTPESASRSAPGCTAACTPTHTTASQQPIRPSSAAKVKRVASERVWPCSSKRMYMYAYSAPTPPQYSEKAAVYSREARSCARRGRSLCCSCDPPKRRMAWQ